MSVDTIHCPRCRSTLLRSDSEGLFHSKLPTSCRACGMSNPLREAVLDPDLFVSFPPRPWPPEGWHSMEFAVRQAE